MFDGAWSPRTADGCRLYRPAGGRHWNGRLLFSSLCQPFVIYFNERRRKKYPVGCTVCWTLIAVLLAAVRSAGTSWLRPRWFVSVNTRRRRLAVWLERCQLMTGGPTFFFSELILFFLKSLNATPSLGWSQTSGGAFWTKIFCSPNNICLVHLLRWNALIYSLRAAVVFMAFWQVEINWTICFRFLFLKKIPTNQVVEIYGGRFTLRRFLFFFYK